MVQSDSNPVVRLRVSIPGADLFTSRAVTVSGRAAWALHELISAADAGCTPIDNPAPRWAHYTWLLRGLGLNVETVHEPHKGAFAGTHARYVLRTAVTILETVRQNDQRKASRGGTFQPLGAATLASCGGAR